MILWVHVYVHELHIVLMALTLTTGIAISLFSGVTVSSCNITLIPWNVLHVLATGLMSLLT